MLTILSRPPSQFAHPGKKTAFVVASLGVLGRANVKSDTARYPRGYIS